VRLLPALACSLAAASASAQTEPPAQPAQPELPAPAAQTEPPAPPAQPELPAPAAQTEPSAPPAQSEFPAAAQTELPAPPELPNISPAAGRGSLFHPDGPGLFAWRIGVGALVDVLPRRVVQSEQRQLPQFTVHARVGLPGGFSADARAAAILLTNQIELGAAWTFPAGPVAIAIQDHQGLWFGFVGLEGFDASGWGWINKPGLSAGMEMEDIRFSLTGELIYTFGQHVRIGGDNISRDKAFFAGTSLTFTVENLLASGRLWYFGVGILYTLPNYEAWVAFSDDRNRFPYPRFFGGYAF
jgi:hypothetical protein